VIEKPVNSRGDWHVLNVREAGMSGRRLGRRKFLARGGIAAGALVVGGAGAWAAANPGIELPEPSYTGKGMPESNGMNARVLIAYASKAGSTAEVADAIARRLADSGYSVDVRRAGRVRSLDGYHAVIVGSAIRAGQWLSEASGLVKRQREGLSTRKTAFFTVCMTLREDTPKNRETVAAYLRPVRAILEPDALEFFAGKMDFSRLALVPRLIVKAMKSQEGDFRNWEAIGAWADRLSSELLARA
jgi:menaquinone-dependent protoporphyrinogen oxidase